jgi:hypothetical protein
LREAVSNENEDYKKKDSKAVKFVFQTFDIENLQKRTMIFLNLNFTILFCNCDAGSVPDPYWQCESGSGTIVMISEKITLLY